MFERFSKLDTLAVKAQLDAFDNSLPYLRFDTGAQGLFNEWRGEFEIRIRSGELPEALEGHLAKFRKLVPTLALLNHLADGGEGPIPQDALKRALAFAAVSGDACEACLCGCDWHRCGCGSPYPRSHPQPAI